MNRELTRTNLKRNRAFWFLIVSDFLVVAFSIYTITSAEKTSDDLSNIVSTYSFFCLSVIGMILGTKTSDNIQKFKTERESGKGKSE